MKVDELRDALDDRRQVAKADVESLLVDADPAVRHLARVILAKSSIREAAFNVVELAREEGFDKQATLDVIQLIAQACDTDIPVIELLKGVGLRAARYGDFEGAMTYLQDAVNRAGVTGQMRDRLSRTAMRFLHDREIDEALDHMAARFEPVAAVPAGDKERIAILVSAVIDENAPSIVTVKYAEGLREQGFDVTVISTEYGTSTGTLMLAEITETETPVVLLPGVASGYSFESRVRAALEYFEANPVHAVHFLITPMDHVGKLLGSIGVASAQLWDSFAYEPHFGKYQFMCHGVSIEQETSTLWPGKSRFVGSFVAMAREIDAAKPFDRSLLGIPKEAVVLSTFGRIEKCISNEYTSALSRVLQRAPSAVLLLAGPGRDEHLNLIFDAFTVAGVRERVSYLGRRQKDGPSLLKATDVYCDTYPWPGGQSVYDAMQAGCPVVSMRRAIDVDLDPSGCGATSNVADSAMGATVELAEAGNVDRYVDIALRYINDPVARRRDGAALRNHAIAVAGFDAKMRRVAALIREAIAESKTISYARR